MRSPAENYLQSVRKDNSIRHHLHQCMVFLSVMVIFTVFWGLKLTGITLAGEAFCGKDEHVHSEECPLQTLICELEESEAHMHTEDCILRSLICGEEEIPAHTHSNDCLNSTFVCTLPETEGHTHSQDCIEKELICLLEEVEAHAHGDGCYTNELICTLPEEAAHAHGEGCYTTHLICGMEEAQAHSHTESCNSTILICGLEESEEHTHDDSCTSTSRTCGLEETPGHSHDDSCKSTFLSCTLPETQGHSHGEGCYEPKLSCQLAEIEGHAHGESCYQDLPGYICGLEEHPAHMHGEGCYEYEEGNYICGLEETVGHSHETACYEFGVGFGCGLTEAEEHIHTAECITPETQFGCEKEISEGHTHGEECYDTLESCPLEEHIHTESCYSDILADIETSDDWEMTLANITRSPSPARNVLSVAQSQLGYTESTRNFEVDENGIRRGITRYGQWYGNPYGDWSSMFTSFCLYYAGIDVPFNGGPEAMRLEWEQEGLFISAQEYSPFVGHVLFLDRDLDGQADATAIIEEYTIDTITVIEGNVPVEAAEPLPDTGEAPPETETVLRHTVARTVIPMDDPIILGYGMVPDDAMLMVLPNANGDVIAVTAEYDPEMLTQSSVFVLYTVSGSSYYAFDGEGNAVLISIDEDGNITADVEDPDSLLWTFAETNTSDSYLIQNVKSGRYMHAFANNGGGVTTAGAYSSALIQSGSGVKIRSNTEYARLDAGAGKFVMTQSQAQAAVYHFGMKTTYTLWLDGTCGNSRLLGGSPDESYSLSEGETFVLPTQWPSPTKYSYRLQGWYDINIGAYYAPGDQISITENTVLYADWVASSYDIGRFNAQVADTVSTNAFITTHMFDYSYLFNVRSSTHTGTITAANHTENWSMVTSGTVPETGLDTYNFIFVENDSGGRIPIPDNRSSHNVYPGSGIVTQGIYSPWLSDLLFSPYNAFDPVSKTGVIGKTYLGTGDHLFQIMDDPSDEHYGYYYYDSHRNAASYNQSAGRFYVYDYLSATTDSIGDNYADFLPLNSPYANTNGQVVETYNYGGINGEYSGVTHYRYDAKYSADTYNSEGNVATNYAYGMRTDIRFYLPQDPGAGGNLDLNGKPMMFEFSGDDDLWVVIDGPSSDPVLALDIGGIHNSIGGSINFSTGEVFVNGVAQTNLYDLGIREGDYTLSILYMERGSSKSNCSIYFNLAPRFSLKISKEDVLTQHLLDGTQFTIYEDFECTKPAKLWENEAQYNPNGDGISTFTVKNGVANIWGLASGNTYYIKETAPPDANGYNLVNGLIRLTIEKDGLSSYKVDVIADNEGNDPSPGFTVHDVAIDEKTKQMNIVVTNAPETVVDTTTVQVYKKWEDTVSHSDDYITAYLTVTDPDGTVRRIREVTLSDENGWKYTWTNLPKYNYNTDSEVIYGIEESYESGYYSTVRRITEISTETVTWGEAYELLNGESYLLKNSSGSYLSATGGRISWVDESTAQSSAKALWTVATSSGNVKLTNGEGQILTFNSGASSSSRYFYTTTGSTNTQYLTPVKVGSGYRFYHRRNYSNYYMYQLNSGNGRITSTSSSSNGMILTPMKKITEENIQPLKDWAYQITNTPLAQDNETSMAVQKRWLIPEGDDPAIYEQFQVTVQLLANGFNTGRSVTLTLKNDWYAVFQGLPYTDVSGNVIRYSVKEVWHDDSWVVGYGEIITYGDSPPAYSTTITNTLYSGGPILPSTGSAARMMYVIIGGSIMLASLTTGILLRRKRERRRN